MGLEGKGQRQKRGSTIFYQILDFATEPEPQVFRQMKERARKYSQALKPSLIKALKQYQTTIIATHVPPYERAAWHEGSPSSPDVAARGVEHLFESEDAIELVVAGPGDCGRRWSR